MNYYAISALIIAFSSVLLGTYIYLRNRRGQINITFFIFTLFVTLWSVGYFLWQISDDASKALFYCRLLMAGAIFVPVSYFHFALALSWRLQEKKVHLIVSYILFFVFFLLNFTSLFVKEVVPAMFFQFWPKPGIAFHFFIILWVLYVVYSSYLIYYAYKNSAGWNRYANFFILLGFIFGFIAGSSNYLLWYDIPFPPFINIFGILYLVGVAYVILRANNLSLVKK